MSQNGSAWTKIEPEASPHENDGSLNKLDKENGESFYMEASEVPWDILKRRWKESRSLAKSHLTRVIKNA